MSAEDEQLTQETEIAGSPRQWDLDYCESKRSDNGGDSKHRQDEHPEEEARTAPGIGETASNTEELLASKSGLRKREPSTRFSPVPSKRSRAEVREGPKPK